MVIGCGKFLFNLKKEVRLLSLQESGSTPQKTLRSRLGRSALWLRLTTISALIVLLGVLILFALAALSSDEHGNLNLHYMFIDHLSGEKVNLFYGLPRLFGLTLTIMEICALPLWIGGSVTLIISVQTIKWSRQKKTVCAHLLSALSLCLLVATWLGGFFWTVVCLALLDCG